MHRIVQYNAPTETLTESTRGTSAFEQAGRRLGPLYNEAASFQKEQGKITAQEYKDMQWPYDIVKLNDRTSKGVGAKVTNAADRTSRTGSAPSYEAPRQISRGAGALGNALRDGGYTMASAKTPATQTLEGGNLVTLAQDAGLTRDYNHTIDAGVTQNTKDTVNNRDYWTQFNGGDPYATDQSGVSSTGPQGVNAPGGPDNLYGTTVYGGEDNTSATQGTSPSPSSGFFSGLADTNASYTPTTTDIGNVGTDETVAQ